MVGEARRVGAFLENARRAEIRREVAHLIAQPPARWVVLVGQLGQQALQVVYLELRRVLGEDAGRLVGVLGHVLRGLHQRPHHAGGMPWLLARKLSARAQHAADFFCVEIGRGTGLLLETGERPARV